MANGNRATLFGLNLIGLQRRGFSESTIAAIKHAYRIIFRSDLLLEEALEKAQQEVADCPEVRHFINFIQKSKRSICR
jgi:UDP-N-acetylglucosamine acyltransferase